MPLLSASLTGACAISIGVRQQRAPGARAYGVVLLAQTCWSLGYVAELMAPDLRASFVVTSAEQFARVVRSGARAARGMPAYAEITDQELSALQHYIRLLADTALRRKP